MTFADLTPADADKPVVETAIIDSATGVILRLTTDESPFVGEGEAAVVLSEKVDLAANGGLNKVDQGGQVVAASLAEWQAAGLDPAFNAAKSKDKQSALLAHLQFLSTDKAQTDGVQTLALLLSAYLS